MSTSGPTYECVIWDWNGTLLDDITLVVNIVNDIFVEHNLEPMSLARYRDIFDFPVEAYYERAGMDLSRVDFSGLSVRFHDAFNAGLHNTRLFPYTSAALHAIKASGMQQFLLSSSEHRTLREMVGDFGLAGLFDDIQGVGDRLGRGKTDAGLELIRAQGIDPRRALMVGDTRHDWEVAQACGMDCVLLATGHQSHARLAALGCPVFDAIEEVPAWLL